MERISKLSTYEDFYGPRFIHEESLNTINGIIEACFDYKTFYLKNFNHGNLKNYKAQTTITLRI
jgi:hypothetical protein